MMLAGRCKGERMVVVVFAPTPRWSVNSFVVEFLNAFFNACEFLSQLVGVFLQSFLFLFCGNEASGEHGACASAGATAAVTSASAAALAVSPGSMMSGASLWSTHFSTSPFDLV
jgi:hypothetical protein